MIQTKPNNNKLLNLYLLLIFIAIVCVTIFIRIRFLPTPLERDEGEYAYAGQLMLQGGPPYQLAYNMKMPGIYAAYAIILAVFGQTHLAIHFAVLIINTATIIFIFFIAKKIFGFIPAIAASVFFAITSISAGIQATANAENFVVLPAIAGILLLMKFIESKNFLHLIFGGLLLGIAFMMKQHGSAFILFGLFYLVFGLFRQKQVSRKRIFLAFSLFSFFAVLPFLVTCLILWHLGVFEKFWFWTFDYARHYVGLISFKAGFANIKGTLIDIIPSAVLIWLLGLIGFISCIFNSQFRRYRVFIISFTVCSFLALCPGLYFRSHYFLLFLPAISMLAALGIITISNFVKSNTKRPYVSVLMILVVWSQSFYAQRHYLMETNPEILSRLTFGFNPFPESLKIAEYIAANSNEDDKIVVFGSEPEIYFYSQRCSATSFIYTYPLMENQPFAIQMQQEMISQIQANKPKFMVVVKAVESWLPWPGCEKFIFQWADKYIPQHYKQVGLVEIFKEQWRTEYHWDSQAKPQKPEGWLMILERID